VEEGQHQKRTGSIHSMIKRLTGGLISRKGTVMARRMVKRLLEGNMKSNEIARHHLRVPGGKVMN